MREESIVEGALPAKHQNATKYKKYKKFDGTRSSSTSTIAIGNWKKSYPFCQLLIVIHELVWY